MSAKEYEDKRDFGKTPQPRARGKQTGEQPVFVIQKHAATNLHFNFRMEIGSSLKRRSIPTEDHPMEYANFEGTIPKGGDGRGTVMVWNRGTYRKTKVDRDGCELAFPECYDLGMLEVALEGKKRYGAYALIRMNSGKMKVNWLLVRLDDYKADTRRSPTSTQKWNVVSERDMDEIALGPGI